MNVVVAADLPQVETPAASSDLFASGGGYWTPSEPLKPKWSLPGAGAFGRVVFDGPSERLRFVVTGGARAWIGRFPLENPKRISTVATHVDVGLATHVRELDGRWVFPSFTFQAGLATNTLHATAEGTLTAFAPHVMVEESLTIGTDAVRWRVGFSGDAIARTDGWGDTTDVAEGQLRWRVNAGQASLRLYVGAEFGGDP